MIEYDEKELARSYVDEKFIGVTRHISSRPLKHARNQRPPLPAVKQNS